MREISQSGPQFAISGLVEILMGLLRVQQRLRWQCQTVFDAKATAREINPLKNGRGLSKETLSASTGSGLFCAEHGNRFSRFCVWRPEDIEMPVPRRRNLNDPADRQADLEERLRQRGLDSEGRPLQKPDDIDPQQDMGRPSSDGDGR